MASTTQLYARLAGIGYLIIVIGGVFAQLFVREALFVSGDPAATTRAIIDNEMLWRAGIAIHLLYLPIGAVVGVLIYRIFGTVEPTLALIALVFNLADVFMEVVLLSRLYIPLSLIEENVALGALSAQQQALTYLAVRSFFTGWGFALLMFAGFCTTIGVVILRSRLVPRLIGGLMIAAGAAYFLNTTAALLAPEVAPRVAPLLVVSFIGEFAFTLWLLFKGVRTPDQAG